MTPAHPTIRPAADPPDPEAVNERRRAAQALHPAARGRRSLDAGVLAVIADGLASVVDRCEPGATGVVRRTRLLDTTAYDAWLLEWGPGAVADDHDHSGSVGVVRVVLGELTEVATDIADGSASQRTIDASQNSTLSVTGRHTLANHTRATCLSVHVYSPPLGEPVIGDPHLA